MPLDDFTGNIQANAQARIGLHLRFANLVEAFKNLLLVGFCDPHTKIVPEAGASSASVVLYV